MRYLILFILIIVLASCTAPAQPTATEPPTPTAKERDLVKAQGVVVRFKSEMSLPPQDLPSMENSAGTEFVDMVCKIAIGEFLPHVHPAELTEEGYSFSAIRNYCTETRWGEYKWTSPPPGWSPEWDPDEGRYRIYY